MDGLPQDPRRRLALGPMTPRQVLAIALCVLLNALDGFDVLSISFASPGIASEWHIERAALGLVISGLGLVALFFIASGLLAERHLGAYVPAHIEKGELVPGGFK